MENVREIVERYVAMWNEGDVDKRRLEIVALWEPDGVHLARRHHCVGYAAIEDRVTRSWNASIAPGLNIFRHADDIDAHHNVVRFRWHMVRRETGAIAAIGQEMLVLGKDGRIRADYQFNEPDPVP